MTFEIIPVPPEKNLTWHVEIDGQVIEPRLLVIESNYGRLVLGWRPEGFHGWAFKPGKGGAITILWSRSPEGEILVGLVHEHRPNMGTEKVWCPLGGIVESGETPDSAAKREALEEGGLDTSASYPLPGVPFNNDRMYYVMEAGDNWGMKTFALEVPHQSLEPCGEGLLRPRPHLISHNKESDIFFLPWKEAVRRSSDLFVSGAVARLLCEIM